MVLHWLNHSARCARNRREMCTIRARATIVGRLGRLIGILWLVGEHALRETTKCLGETTRCFSKCRIVGTYQLLLGIGVSCRLLETLFDAGHCRWLRWWWRLCWHRGNCRCCWWSCCCWCWCDCWCCGWGWWCWWPMVERNRSGRRLWWGRWIRTAWLVVCSGTLAATVIVTAQIQALAETRSEIRCNGISDSWWRPKFLVVVNALYCSHGTRHHAWQRFDRRLARLVLGIVVIVLHSRLCRSRCCCFSANSLTRWRWRLVGIVEGTWSLLRCWWLLWRLGTAKDGRRLLLALLLLLFLLRVRDSLFKWVLLWWRQCRKLQLYEHHMIAQAYAKIERRFTAQKVIHLIIVERLECLHHGVFGTLSLIARDEMRETLNVN